MPLRETNMFQWTFRVCRKVRVVSKWRYGLPIPFSLNGFPCHQTLSLLHKINRNNTSAALFTVCSFGVDDRKLSSTMPISIINMFSNPLSVYMQSINWAMTTLVVRFPGPHGQLGERPTNSQQQDATLYSKKCHHLKKMLQKISFAFFLTLMFLFMQKKLAVLSFLAQAPIFNDFLGTLFAWVSVTIQTSDVVHKLPIWNAPLWSSMV